MHVSRRGRMSRAASRLRTVDWTSEGGQTLPLLVLIMVLTVFASVMVIDFGMLYRLRANAHAAADLAALAAVQDLPDEDAAIAAAFEAAQRNRFDDDAPDVQVTVEVDGVPCARPNTCVRVIIQREFDWTFGGLLSLGAAAARGSAIAEKSSQPREIVFVFDKSGSVQPMLNDLKRGAIQFSESPNLAPGGGGDRLGLVSFAEEAKLELPFTSAFGSAGTDFRVALNAIQGASGTNVRPALDEAIALIATTARPGTDRYILLLSDGGFEDADRLSDLNTQLNAARAANIVIYTVGVSEQGNTIDPDGVMAALAPATGGSYLPNPNWRSGGTANSNWNRLLDQQLDNVAAAMTTASLSE